MKDSNFFAELKQRSAGKAPIDESAAFKLRIDSLNREF
jgi:hypothetical protein